MPSPTPPTEPAEEVRILAPHREVGETAVRREDTRDVPGTFGDPTRIAEALPGMVPSTSGLQAFFVRGAPPTSTGVFIDEVPVPVLYHVGLGPSVVHPALVDRVELFQGAAPARFGRTIGGTIATTTARPEDHAHAEGNARLFDVGALAEAPLAEGRASALAAARYGYPGWLVPLFAPDIGLAYWDYQARATWNVSERDRLGAFVFGSYDRLTQRQQVAGEPVTRQLVDNEFHRADLRWDRSLGPAATMRLAATLGRDLAGADVDSGIDDIVRLRASIDASVSRDVRVRGGADVQMDWLRARGAGGSLSFSSNASVPSRDTVVAGAYADAVWRISPRVEIVPGVRVDAYKTQHVLGLLPVDENVRPAVDPRLAARVRLSPAITAVSTLGVSHQLPGLFAQVPDVAPLLVPGIQEELQGSAQLSQGVDIALPWRVSVSATAFLHDYFGLPDWTTPCATGPGPAAECIVPGVNGRAYGLELLVRRPFTERFTFWIAYTLSRSTRQARPWWSDVPTMDIPSEYDRTHVVTAIASYELGGRWRAAARVFAYSGRPYTEIAQGLPVIPYNSARLPGFVRLDLRAEKSWLLSAHERLAVVVEGMNVTLNREAVSASCGGPTSPAVGSGNLLQACAIDRVGPIVIPSIGVEWAFQ